MKVFVAALVCVLAGLCYGEEKRINRIGPYDWALVSHLGMDVTFSCELFRKDNDTEVSLLPNGTSVAPGSHRWILPGQTVKLGPVYNKGNVQILGDNLTIADVTLENKGIFHCYEELVCDQGFNCTGIPLEMWFKHGLNLNGPLYDNMLDKYRLNLIMAGASSGGVLGLILMLCLIYKFRFKDPMLESAAIEMQGITSLDEGHSKL